jgi:hypothetical protein
MTQRAKAARGGGRVQLIRQCYTCRGLTDTAERVVQCAGRVGESLRVYRMRVCPPSVGR